MELPAKSRHDLEQSLHVLPFRVEVHNAGAKTQRPCTTAFDTNASPLR